MNIDYDELRNKVIGCTIPKPSSGTLSGHAAGEPFDKCVYSVLKEQYRENTFRQYEYLNDLFSKNPTAKGYEKRMALFPSSIISFLLARGKDATKKWSLTKQFEEKQNDTADILMVKDDFYNLIDVKTRNISKSSQAPNIISSYKLAQLCAKMIDTEKYDNFSIDYFEIDWALDGKLLRCTDAHHACLFNCDPEKLYINWASGMQIQFHVCDADQSFEGSRAVWAELYLKHFVEAAEERIKYMREKYINAFESYLL